MNDKEKLQSIEDLIYSYAQISGSHHKMWVLDQILRVVKGGEYEKWVEKYEYMDDEGVKQTEKEYTWDVGIAP